jgi:acyl carrier protein
MKQKILDRLNEIIEDEKGSAVTMDSKFLDSELDSLGTVLTIAILESEYPFLAGVPLEEDAFQKLDIENLTIRELIKKCVLSITNPSTEQNSEKDT